MTLERQSAFARRLGKDRAHVTRLKQAGRLVMRDGLVVVEDTLRLLEATESPLPRDQANRERLAAERAGELGERAGIGYGPSDGPSLEAIGRRIKFEQAKKMAAEAAMAEMERRKMEGRLALTEDVLRAGAETAAAVRADLEGLADRVAPELAAATETAACHALLAEAIEQVLDELSRRVAALTERVASP